jgi:magnesium transporter
LKPSVNGSTGWRKRSWSGLRPGVCAISTPCGGTCCWCGAPSGLSGKLNALIREETPLITQPVRRYLRDSLDHVSQIADVVETYREITSSLMDMYLSSTGQRTNEVMKVLTIMASIFIPLTFLAGVYGTNFDYLPELNWRWAYFAFWGVMIVLVVGMLLYFRHKGWIGHPDEEDDEEADIGA